MKVNNAVLMEFTRRGLKINEGIAVDARLIKSASRPISKEQIEKEKESRGK